MQGSNACTLIATMIGMLHLKKKLPELALPDKIVEVFVEKMQEGNSLYDIISPMFASVTKVLPIKVSADDIKGITDQVHLTNELKFVCQIPNPSAHLLFVPPDKCMSLLINHQEIILFESHKHGKNGALIAYCKKSAIDNFVIFLVDMFQQDWGANVAGSNLVQIKL